MTMTGTPDELGFVRSIENDRFNPDCECYLTPEGVLLVLPAGVKNVVLTPIRSPRGDALVCLDPPGVKSLWPVHKRK
jgi:hypothetical protein